MRKVHKILGAIVRSVIVLALVLASTGLTAQAAPADNLDSQINQVIERANSQSGVSARQEGDSTVSTGGRSGNLSSDSGASASSSTRQDDPTLLRYPYVINNYDVKVSVNRYNKYHIDETIEVTFNQPRHGIFRSIQNVNYARRSDGSVARINAIVTNLRVPTHQFETKRSGGLTKLRLGDSHRNADKHETYRISYDYDIGHDTLENADELYFNIIGTNWETVIQHVTFEITLPKSFDSKPGFSSGHYGSSGTNIGRYAISGDSIIGETTEALNPREALTIRLTLPEGYFEIDHSRDALGVIGMILMVLVSAAYFIIAIIKRRQERYKVTPVVQYEPPAGLNSLEVALVDRGVNISQDVVSLLIYLADKGYIKISTKDKKAKRDFTLTKLKDYDGKNEAEKEFMAGLFNSKHPDSVTSKQLNNQFYTTVNAIISAGKDSEVKKRYFGEKDPLRAKLLIVKICAFIALLIGALLGVIAAVGVVEENMLYSSLFVISAIIFSSIATVNNGKKWSAVGVTILSLIFVNTSVFLWRDYFNSVPLMVCCAISASLITIASAIAGPVYHRTEAGYKLKGEIMGFKEFIETVDKPRIEAMVEQDPQLFYHILPYAYALGVSKAWVSQFEGIAVQPADWCDVAGAYNYASVVSFMDHGMPALATSMGVTPSGGAAIGGGGGFAGGGVGGGGGGSW